MNKLEAIDLHKINGHEILEFLNEQLDKLKSLRRISMCGEFQFVNQSIGKGGQGKELYELNFKAYFNNWGTLQEFDGNSIQIDESGVAVLVDEPFEGDGSEEAIEEVLREWVFTHVFKPLDEVEAEWRDIIQFCKEKLSEVKYEEIGMLEKIIGELKEARTLMK